MASIQPCTLMIPEKGKDYINSHSGLEKLMCRTQFNLQTRMAYLCPAYGIPKPSEHNPYSYSGTIAGALSPQLHAHSPIEQPQCYPYDDRVHIYLYTNM